MDFFCQRCGKTVDVDESLLSIDVSMLEKGEIDLDRVIKRGRQAPTASVQSTPLNKSSSSIRNSSSSMSVKRDSRSVFFTSPTSTTSADSTSRTPHKSAHSESPFVRVSSTFTRPSKILLEKKQKTPPSSLNISTSSPTIPSSTTPPSPNGSKPPSPHIPANSTPPQFVTPFMVPSTSFSASHGPTSSPGMSKSRSEFFHSPPIPHPDGNRTMSSIYSSSTSMQDGSQFGSSFKLKYVRRPSVRPDTFVPTEAPSAMHSFPSAPDLHRMASTISPPVSHLSPAEAQAAVKLFHMVSEQIGVDLPLCNECAKTLIADLDEELSMMESQNESYMYFMDQLEQKEKKWPSFSDMEEELLRLEEEERELRVQLTSLNTQKRAISAEVAHIKAEGGKLINFEERYWLNFDELHVTFTTFLDERDACKVETNYMKDLLLKVQQTQIINDAFYIWHDGHFGTINSFRLGRLPSQPVDWNEINAAWGLATLLLYNMAKRIGFHFSTYRLVPSGSCSKMERIDNSSTYELFGSSDISLGRLFWYRRFDNGMVAFLMCLKEMGDFAENRDKSFKLPHKMEKDKVGDMSIKIQFNNEETWTKSLKYMLTNLKWLLAWVVRMEGEQLVMKHGKPAAASEKPPTTTSPAPNNTTTNTTTTPARAGGTGSVQGGAGGAAPPPANRASRLSMLFTSRSVNG